MEAQELADRIVDALLSTFYQATHVEGVLARQNSKALEILVLSNSDSIGAINQTLLQWILFDTVLESIDEALGGGSSVASTSSLEIKFQDDQESDLEHAPTVLHMVTKKMGASQSAGIYSMGDVPWDLISRQPDST